MSERLSALHEVLDRLAVPQAARAAITARHGEPHRHYHTLRHVDMMLRQIPEHHVFAREMYVATLFHDIVYEPVGSDNEEQSLSVFLSFADTIAGGAALDADLLGAMILATKSHHFREEATAGDMAVNLLLKADLSILWHPDPPVYAWYAEGVRKEFAFVPDDSFREARTRILTGLRDDLLRSDKLEPQEAKVLVRNVAWELGQVPFQLD